MRCFFILLGCLIAHVVPCSSSPDTLVQRIQLSDECLHIGILSDAQFPENDEQLSPGHLGVVMNGPKHVLRALSYFKQQDVDLIIMNGDMVNAAAGGNAYRTYNLLLDHVFGKERENMPPLIYPMGNHEFYGANAEDLFLNQVKLPLNVHYVLNGYHFIGVSCSDSQGGYASDRLEYLKKHLEIAGRESEGKPIVVISHMPFHVDEFWGGQWDSPQSDAMYRILSAYPQVIYLSGHSHYPLFDDKSFLQRDFTMVNTGSTSYFDLDWNLAADGKTLDEEQPNEYLNPHLLGICQQADINGRDDVNQGWMMTIDTKKDCVVLQRMDYNLQRPFGKPIILSDLVNKKFDYTLNQLRESAAIPAFRRKTSLEVLLTEKNGADICFDAADHTSVVKQYEMEVEDPDHQIQRIRFLAKGYYMGWDFPYKEHIHYRGCHKNGKYSLRIRAINCWGEKSKWLKTSFLVEPAIVQCREQ